MAIPSRQIGWGTEENLLWQISKQMESLTGVAYTSGGIKSVGLSMPPAFSVPNSPLTSNGTLNVIANGTVNQYVRGDGTLAEFTGITNVITVTTNYLALQTDSVILANAAGGAITITLPSAIGTNKPITIKRINAGANAVNINTVLGQTFDGSTTGSINVENQSLTFVSNNANWFII